MGRTGSLRLKEEARDVSREKREGRGRAGLILEKFRGGGRRRLAGREGGEGGKVKARFDPPFLSFAPNSISAQISSFLHRTRLWTSLPSDRPLHFTMESSSSSSKNKRMRTVVASSPRSSSSLRYDPSLLPQAVEYDAEAARKFEATREVVIQLEVEGADDFVPPAPALPPPSSSSSSFPPPTLSSSSATPESFKNEPDSLLDMIAQESIDSKPRIPPIDPPPSSSTEQPTELSSSSIPSQPDPQTGPSFDAMETEDTKPIISSLEVDSINFQLAQLREQARVRRSPSRNSSARTRPKPLRSSGSRRRIASRRKLSGSCLGRSSPRVTGFREFKRREEGRTAKGKGRSRRRRQRGSGV